MEDAEPVIDQATVAKLVTPKPRSEVAFPYFSLDKSIEVPKVIHDRAGGRCGRGQLAGLLGYSGVKNGGFLTRISAAKMFGLIEENGDVITLTDRARKILSPVRASDAEQARLDAFMAVELYRKVFDDFDGHTLPSSDGLSNLFLTQYKIVPNQVAPALRNLMDSAETAGLFKVSGNRTKLIRPIIRNDGPPAQTVQPEPASVEDDATPDEVSARGQRNGGRNGSNGAPSGPDLSGVHPALAGLIQNLPPVGSTLGPKRRAALIDAFKHTINFIYPEEED
ncbi:MAG: hypothetical protein HUU30_12090 [Burkholderiaceae bacterium]|nr:hypothetical protein [Aquabacterium sp.]NUP86476.1 hypothetical protein [Burkholderiaceae bacterium]